MSAVSTGSSIYLHGCRDDRFGKNCLGTITFTTSSNRNQSATGENNLVLFTVATRLQPIIDDDTDNRICQGDPRHLCENDSYLNVNIRNLTVIDDQMIEAGKDNRIVNLFTKGPHHRNLSVIYIVRNLFHQGKGNRSISLNSHYLVLFKNPRDKLQILTPAKQMYPSETAWFIKEYEKAVRRPFGYLFVDLNPTTPDRCRLRTNVLPGEEKFDKGFEENKISQELLQYLKQQTLMVAPSIPQMQRIQNNMDNLLYRTNLGEDEKEKQYMQLQNRFLTYKHQLKSL